MRWLLLGVLLLGFALAEDYPANWKKQETEFRSCPANAKSSYAYFNHLTKYFDTAGHLRALEYMATGVTDVVDILSFNYLPSGQLTKVKHSTMGLLGGDSGRDEWTVKAGKVVAATRSSMIWRGGLRPSVRFEDSKSYSHPIPLNSIPALYLGQPTPQWMGQVAFSRD